jgi:hypothetical protein
MVKRLVRKTSSLMERVYIIVLPETIPTSEGDKVSSYQINNLDGVRNILGEYFQGIL